MPTIFRSRCLAAAGALLTLVFSLAASATSQDVTLAGIKRTLAERYPQAKVIGVEPAPVPGIYSVFMEDNTIAYSDATGDYLFVGKMIDTRARRDLASDLLSAHYPVDYQKLPFAHSIKVVKGNGSRQIAVFEDPDCPFCLQLEKELQSLDNLTEYVFLYPLSEVHPDAMKHALDIWCSTDRSATWTQWMGNLRKPLEARTCDGDPIAEIRALTDKYHIQSTPTIILPDGRRLQGALPVEQLQAAIDSANEKKLASADPTRN